jgi:hypothetical protein
MWERRGAYKVLLGKPEEGDHLEDSDVDGKIILTFIILEKGNGNLDCIDLAQDKARWRAVVNTVMNLRFP